MRSHPGGITNLKTCADGADTSAGKKRLIKHLPVHARTHNAAEMSRSKVKIRSTASGNNARSLEAAETSKKKKKNIQRRQSASSIFNLIEKTPASISS